MENFAIREIIPADNQDIAIIIRESLEEFGANRPGTVYYDESTDHLYELFQTPKAGYFVALQNDTIIGGAGVFPSNGLPADTTELVKMYLAKSARGKGIGKTLIDHCLAYAKKSGYTAVYLETMPELKKALATYEKFGFEYLSHPMGNTGHFGCDRWMLKKI